MPELWEWVKPFGPVATLLAVALFASYRNVWCWSAPAAALLLAEEKRHAETKADRDRWQDIAFNALGLAKSATNVLERSAK